MNQGQARERARELLAYRARGGDPATWWMAHAFSFADKGLIEKQVLKINGKNKEEKMDDEKKIIDINYARRGPLLDRLEGIARDRNRVLTDKKSAMADFKSQLDILDESEANVLAKLDALENPAPLLAAMEDGD